jgi:4-diphosphocytidyl-2C-methyl-D-erythritol kinase
LNVAVERIVRLKARAKINLGLVVGLPRSDGYHDLTTVFVRVNLCDEVELRTGKSLRSDCRLQITDYRVQNARKDLPTGKDNLCVKAARRFQQAAGIRQPVEIRLKKRIPVGAGLGGGSSDAAAVLKGMNRLFGRPLDTRRMHDLALELGSDVPFFLRRSACIATGRGDVLKTVRLPKLHVLLHVPGFPVSTPWAYHELDRLRRRSARNPEWNKPQRAQSAQRIPSRENSVLTGQVLSLPTRSSGSSSVSSVCSVVQSRDLKLVAGLTQQAFCLNIALARLKAGRFSSLADLLHNSFEEPVFRRHPGLRTIKVRFLKAGADAALLSGSGSALFALVRPTRLKQVQRALERDRVLFLSLETMA